jgi:hypothetical protein
MNKTFNINVDKLTWRQAIKLRIATGKSSDIQIDGIFSGLFALGFFTFLGLCAISEVLK